MPDPLVWQSGIEYGLQALAGLPLVPWHCSIHRHGPTVESVAFAVHQLGVDERVSYCFRFQLYSYSCHRHIALFPRVASLDIKIILFALRRGMKVVASDPAIAFEHPNLFLFPRRDWQALRDVLCLVLEPVSQ